jgi:hypothetical protein
MNEKQLPEDQISPKSILLSLFSLKTTVKKEWKLILSMGVIGALCGVLYDVTHVHPSYYSAKLVFNLESSGGAAGGGALGDLASALGLGSPATSGLFAGENFNDLIRTRRTAEKALLSEVTIKGKKWILANYFLKHGKAIEEFYEDDEAIQPPFLFKHTNIEDLDSLEIRNLNTVREYFSARTDVVQENRKSSFQSIITETFDQDLSIIWLKALMKSVTEYYRETKTEKSRELYDIMKRRTDSLRASLYGTEYRLSKQIDQNQNIVAQAGRIEEMRLQRNSSQLGAMYVQALQQLDNIRMTMIRESPIVTIIEEPRQPLQGRHYRFGRIINGLAILGVILAFFYIYIRDTYRKVMQEQA